MRVILDECLPKRLIAELPGHDVSTVPLAGWAGVQNGDLLRRIAGQFDVFITVDANLAFQQQLSSLPFGIVVLRAPSNRIEDLRPLLPELLNFLKAIKPGQVVQISD